jgi:hypothetical protein
MTAHHALLCIIVSMTSVCFMHVFNYIIVDIMAVMQICILCLLDLTVTSGYDRKVLVA